MKYRLFLAVTATGLSLLQPACSFKQMALDQTTELLKDALPAFEQESDYEFAAQAFPASIKTIEGFLQAGPNNQTLLLMLAQAYASYGLVVLEDQWELAEPESAMEQHLRARTREMYLRGHRYGLRLLGERHAELRRIFEQKNADALKSALANTERDDVPALFWTALPLANAINVSRDDIILAALLPKAKALMERVIELDESYYHAGAHLVLGSMYGSVSSFLGGDANLSRKHFDRAVSLTKRSFLLAQLMYAKTLAVQLQDRAMYQKLLTEIINAPLSINPQQQLANIAAKRRAQFALKQINNLF